MRLQAPAVIGQTALFAMQHPASAAGNLYVFLWSPPFAGAAQISLPGFTVNGLARVDLANFTVATAGILDGSGLTPSYPVSVPNLSSLVGFAWDLQSVDLYATSTWTFADDDLAMTVAAPPPAASMVGIAAGTFQMGSVVVGGTATAVHQVTISRPFWMGKYEVTQAQYQAVMGSNPSYFPGANLPVDRVNRLDAGTYCLQLSVQEAAAGRLPSGYVYRLPTEAEWEYCCRAGTTTEWNVGTSLSCIQANFYDISGTSCGTYNQPNAVGSYAANAWGLHDMHGNAWEWTLDNWDGVSGYPAGPVTDPFVGGTPIWYGIRRGGSSGSVDTECRSAYRNRYAYVGTDPYGGFRVVCAPVLP